MVTPLRYTYIRLIENEENVEKTEKNETKLVQLNMRTHTLEQVAAVKERTHAESSTAAIRMSIEIADMVTKTIERGGKVILDVNGEKQEIVMPSMPHR